MHISAISRSLLLLMVGSLAMAGNPGGEGQRRRPIAIVPLAYVGQQSQDEAWVGMVVAEQVRMGLDRVGGFQVTPPTVALKCMKDKGKDATQPLDAQTCGQVGRALGAERVVSGTYQVRDDRFTVKYRITDVATGWGIEEQTLSCGVGKLHEVCCDLLTAVVRSYDKRVDSTDPQPKTVEAPAEDRVLLGDKALRGALDMGTASPGAWELDCRGGYEMANGRPAQTVRFCTQALEIDPKFASALAHRGNARMALHQDDQALEDLDNAILLKPKVPTAYLWRATVLLRRNEFRRAVDDFDCALRLRPSDPFILCGRSLAKSSAGDYDSALADANEALRIRAAYPYAYYSRAVTELARGLLAESLADCNKALEASPSWDPAYYIRAKIYAERKDYGRAWADLNAFKKSGYVPEPEFVRRLRTDSGRQE